MYIGATDYGYRSTPEGMVVEQPTRMVSAGVSMSGDVSVVDFGHTQQDIPITFIGLTTTLKDTMKSYLMTTIKPYGTVSVTPDTGDDLGISASGATNVTFISFYATFLAPNIWQVDVLLRKYT